MLAASHIAAGRIAAVGGGHVAADRPWDDIPGVAWVGLLMGLGFLVIAIRAMFGKK